MSALAFIGWLYKIERRARALTPDERYAPRQRYAVPLLSEFNG